MLGSPPKRLFHNPQLRTTVPLAESWSSLAAKPRPRAGSTPRVGNKFQEQSLARTFSGSCPLPPERLYSNRPKMARSEKLRLCFLHSSNTPPETTLYGNL